MDVNIRHNKFEQNRLGYPRGGSANKQIDKYNAERQLDGQMDGWIDYL